MFTEPVVQMEPPEMNEIDSLREQLAAEQRTRLAIRDENNFLLEQLAASQLEVQRLREALDVISERSHQTGIRVIAKDVLSIPSDTSALIEHEARVLEEAATWFEDRAAESMAALNLRQLAQQKREGA